MSESIADVLLHPVRLRVVRALAPAREATIAEVAAALPDVPPATLYRHVNKLARSGLIEIASERAVRGAVERVYRIARGTSPLGDLRDASRDDHLRYFMTFLAVTIDDFVAYLDRGDPDYVRDGVGYRQVPLDLTDAEFAAMTRALAAALAPFVGRAPSPKRKPRLFSTIVMPAARRAP